MEKSSSSRSPSILLHFAGAAELLCSFLLFITCGCGRPSEPTASTAETMSPKELSPEMQALADRLQQVSSVVRNSDEFWGHRHRFKDAHFEVDTSNPKLVRRVTMCAKSGAFFPYLDSSDISDLEDYSLRTPTQDEDVLLLKPFAQTITSLDLAKTAITDQSLQTLSQFTSLELLSLSGTELCGDDLKLLTSLTKLRYLNLTESTLGPLQLDFLGELTSLERVELSPSMITDHVLNVLGKLPNLRELNLAESSISDRGMEALTGLKLLEELDLSKTNVTDEAMRHVARLPSLKHLNLGGTKITGVGLVAIGNHPRLERLDLSGTTIDDSGLANLSKLEHLTFVNLRDTHVRGHGINQLRECKELAGVNLPPIPLSAVASINQIKSWTHLGLQVMAEDDSSVLDEAASLTFDDMFRLASLHIESMTPIHVMAVRNCPQLKELHLKADGQGTVLSEIQLTSLPFWKG